MTFVFGKYDTTRHGKTMSLYLGSSWFIRYLNNVGQFSHFYFRVKAFFKLLKQ